MKKILVILLTAASIASCQGYSTHGKFITEHKDAWMNGYVSDEKGKETDKDDSADKGLVFCRANPTENGKAEPVCFKAKFQ
jgi:hypothetical protein